MDIIKRRRKRQKKLISNSGYKDELAKKLVLAADKFIVYRKSTDAKTIIAGYHGLQTGKRHNDSVDWLDTFNRKI